MQPCFEFFSYRPRLLPQSRFESFLESIGCESCATDVSETSAVSRNGRRDKSWESTGAPIGGGGLHQVDRVLRAKRLGKNVVNTSKLEDHANAAALPMAL